MPENENDYGPDILTLVDEDGHEHEFEIADIMEFEDNRYMALIPCAEKPEDVLEDSGELVVLKVVVENEEEFLEPIEDEEEFGRVSDQFMERHEGVYEFEDEDGECSCGREHHEH